MADWVLQSLEMRWPSSVDRESVVVTGEREDASIVLVPHRQLGGFTLAVFASKRGIDYLWGRVADLSTHDDLDLAIRCDRVEWSDTWRAQIQQRLFAELERPIAVLVRRRFFGLGVYASVEIEGKARREFIGSPPAGYSSDETTSLSASEPLGATFPVPIDNWRKWG